ncbi:arsenate reductase ArsC [Desulfobacula sp.]|uniref:arsenate reductase ArsC n=1 Tax=Desulfobacula sp. TaxID=2593537 RepID=UPI00345B8DCB
MDKLKILFLCTGNSCRSQMAEGWTRHLKEDFIDVYSAGIDPQGIDPHAVTVMAEAGVDITDGKAQHLNKFKNKPFDYVITVCGHAHETCPRFPGGSKIIHVGFDDPPEMAKQYETREEKLDCYRKIRDEIKAYILTLPCSLNIFHR